MTKDKALKLALEALEYHTAQTRPIAATEAAIAAIKEALAQPAQQQKIKRDTTVEDDICPSDTDYHNE